MPSLFISILGLFFWAYAAKCCASADVVYKRWGVCKFRWNKKKYNSQWYNPLESWIHYNDKEKIIQIATQNLYFKWLAKTGKIKSYWFWQKDQMIASILIAFSLFFIAGYVSKDFVWVFIESLVITPVSVAVWYYTYTYYHDRELIIPELKKKWLWLKSFTLV